MISKLNLLFILFIAIVFRLTTFGQEEANEKIDLAILIDAALENNPGLKAKLANVEISRQEINITKSAIRPQIAANAFGSLTNEYNRGSNYSSIGSGISMSQTLWQNGKYNALIKQSEYLNLAEQADFDAEKHQLILQVKLQYFNLLRFRSLYEISLNNIAQAELFLQAAEEKSNLGVGKQSDILRAESELADANYISKNIVYSLKNIENQLTRLTGCTISDKNLVKTLNLDDINYILPESDSVFAMALNHYPELKALRNIQSSQDFYEKAVRADRFPALNANAAYNAFYNPLSDGRGIWIAGVSASWDLFDGQRKKTQIQIERLRNQSIQFQKEDLLVELRKEIENRILAMQEAKDQIEISKVLKNSRAENLKIIEEEYKLGIGSMLELSIAQTDDFEASTKIINAITDYKIAIALVERTIGINTLITE